MSDTITTGPVVIYTYSCAVCGERYTGIGPHCPDPLPLARQQLMGIAFDRFHAIADAGGGRAPLSWALHAVVLAVAAEVLTDPRHWARELGLPPPRISLPKPAGTLTPQHVNVEQEWDDYTTALAVVDDGE